MVEKQVTHAFGGQTNLKDGRSRKAMVTERVINQRKGMID